MVVREEEEEKITRRGRIRSTRDGVVNESLFNSMSTVKLNAIYWTPERQRLIVDIWRDVNYFNSNEMKKFAHIFAPPILFSDVDD